MAGYTPGTTTSSSNNLVLVNKPLIYTHVIKTNMEISVPDSKISITQEQNKGNSEKT